MTYYLSDSYTDRMKDWQTDLNTDRFTDLQIIRPADWYIVTFLYISSPKGWKKSANNFSSRSDENCTKQPTEARLLPPIFQAHKKSEATSAKPWNFSQCSYFLNLFRVPSFMLTLDNSSPKWKLRKYRPCSTLEIDQNGWVRADCKKIFTRSLNNPIFFLLQLSSSHNKLMYSFQKPRSQNYSKFHFKNE